MGGYLTLQKKSKYETENGIGESDVGRISGYMVGHDGICSRLSIGMNTILEILITKLAGEEVKLEISTSEAELYYGRSDGGL